MKKLMPGPGQESVWDYPRPPRVEATARRLRVVFNGQVVAETTRGRRVLETSHPPTYYIPREDVRMEFLVPGDKVSACEFKGVARYWHLQVGGATARNAAWSYATTPPAFEAIRGHFAFHAGQVEACYVDGEKVTPQPGDFYGGWITSHVVGPFKGGPGTWGW